MVAISALSLLGSNGFCGAVVHRQVIDLPRFPDGAQIPKNKRLSPSGATATTFRRMHVDHSFARKGSWDLRERDFISVFKVACRTGFPYSDIEYE